MLSIRMIKLCGNSICKFLSVIFNDCLNEGKFPYEWKKLTLYPYIRKETYRPISLLPICSKIFERLIFNEIVTFFTENNFISPNQSGFRPGDSCVNQLLAITSKFINRLMRGLKLEWFSQIYLKLSISYGMKIFFSN